MNASAVAKSLRAYATRPDAQARIDRDTFFQIGSRRFHNSDHPDIPGDRRVAGGLVDFTPPHILTAMELIDDACDFERIADKLKSRK